MGKFTGFEDEAWEELDTLYEENPDYVPQKEGEYMQGVYNDYTDNDEDRYLGVNQLDIVEEDELFDGDAEAVENIVYEFTNEDGSVSHFELIARLDDEDQTYVVMFPLENNPENNLVCLRVSEGPEGDALFSDINDEEEQKKVQDMFEWLMEESKSEV